MNHASVRRIYKVYAPFYDILVAPFFRQGQKTVVELMQCQPDENVIEIGVGTGVSLVHYPPETRICGIDISREMLSEAEKRVKKCRLNNVGLEVMDAEAMRFADNTFDKAACMHVVSVAPNPKRLMDEVKRVCKPDADIFIVNHFSNGNRLIAGAEKLLSPLSKLLGFRPRFPMQDFITSCGLDVRDTSPINLFGYWTMIHAKNNKAAASEQD